MDDFIKLLSGPDSLIWSVELPLLDIDLAGIEPEDYNEYITLLIEALTKL